MATNQELQVKRLPSKDPFPPEKGADPAHWVGNPPKTFKNPWPSFQGELGLLNVLQLRFGSDRNFVPVPETRDELVNVRKPDWGRSLDRWQHGLKATWLGHAGFLVETSISAEGADSEGAGVVMLRRIGRPTSIISDTNYRMTVQAKLLQITGGGEPRGIRILFDAVFSERTSPVSFAGPKRYTPTPCTISELPDVDVIVISHDHYDHMDLATIKEICQQQNARNGPRPHFFAGLGNASNFLAAGAGIKASEITECDWWDCIEVIVPGHGAVELTCTPAQHFSGRGIFDRAKTLWCSWCVVDRTNGQKLFFAGDTAYKSAKAPSECPAFKQIGDVFDGFDLALLPIGLFMPREAASLVHCSPEDSLEVHKDIRSRKSIGMHYGTVRGGLSMYYEDVRDPPRLWQEACNKEGKWGTECGLCDVGETVMV